MKCHEAEDTKEGKLKCAICLTWDGLKGAHCYCISGLEGPVLAVGERGTYCPSSFLWLFLTTGMSRQWPICRGKRKIFIDRTPEERAALTQPSYVAKTREVNISLQQKHQYSCSSAGKTLCQVSRKSIFGSSWWKFNPLQQFWFIPKH